MKQSQLIYLNSVSQSIPSSNLRELNDCIEFDKVIRIEIQLKSIIKLTSQVHNLGLNYSVGDASFKVVVDEAMNDWSSTLQNCSDADSNAMRSVYLHSDKKICDYAKLLDSNDNDLGLGLLLEYPQCCVEAYLKWQHDNEDIDPITTITNSFSFTGELQEFDFPNPFTRYFGSGLFSHFPCSLRCTQTSKAAQLSLEKLQKNFPIIADNIVRLENSFVMFHKDKGVCLWNRVTVNKSIVVLDQNSFCGQGELKRVFESVYKIEISQIELKLFSLSDDINYFKTDGCFIGVFNTGMV